MIYELHVRTFTMYPNSGVSDERRGTYHGIIENIPYLKDLCITVVELMPFTMGLLIAVAEDLLQEAFTRNLHRLSDVPDEGLVPWFYRVLRNAAIDRHRRKGAEERSLAVFARELAEAAARGLASMSRTRPSRPSPTRRA